MHSNISKKHWEHVLQQFIILFLIVVATAAAFQGFFSKWAFRDGAVGFGVEAELAETAERPFVYRQLLPQTAKAITQVLPEQSREKLSQNLDKRKPAETIYSRAKVPENYAIEYYLMMTMCYLAFVVSIWQLRKILIEITHDAAAGTLAALLFAMLIPFLETMGGYYYDFFEILFFVLAVRFALHGNIVALFILVPFATWNKEAFFWFLPVLFPFFRRYYSRKKTILLLAGTVVLAGACYLPVHIHYAGNPGGTVSFQFMHHLKELLQLKTYYVTSTTYGLPLGAQMFFLHILFVAYLVKKTWKRLPLEWRVHAKIACVITIPLFWLFCHPGELRNLSFLYPTFWVMMAYFIHFLLAKQYTTQGKENPDD